uniref:Uncharacterized protein n=1 Tax=Anguilla anguilla TaxID=7936 RepID=A0A0E9SYT5_ANGAN
MAHFQLFLPVFSHTAVPGLK